jgi:hypothetical protein
MEQSPFEEADGHSTRQQISRLFWNTKVIAMLTTAHN